MMKFYTLCLTFVIGFSVTAQDMENLNSKDYEQFIFKHKVYELPYRLLKPKNDNDESYPLIIFLHGSGERGKDNQ